MATTKLVDFDEALMLLEDEHDDPKMTFEPTIVPEDIEISTTLEQLLDDGQVEAGEPSIPVPVEEEEPTEELITVRSNEEDERIRLRMRLLLAHFNQEQLERYEIMRRASLPKSIIRRLIHQFTGISANHNVVIAMAGMVKVFVGELVEEALDIQESEQSNSESSKQPLIPRHLFLALDKFNQQGGLFPAKPRICTFLNS